MKKTILLIFVLISILTTTLFARNPKNKLVSANIMFKKAVSFVSTSAILATPFLVGAQPVLPDAGQSGIQTYGQLRNKFDVVGNWMFGILLLLAVIFIIVAAFKYLTSGGDAEKTKSARDFIIYAVIAIAVAILAKGIIALVGSFFGVNTNA